MGATSWTLFDHSHNQHVGAGFQAGETLRAQLNRHQVGLSAGVETVDLDNGRLRLRVIPTRGMSIWKAYWRTDDANTETLGWNSPVRGPVHPSFVPLHAPDGLGWLDGFDELLVRCGLQNNGAPEFEQGQLKYPLHGRIGNTPAYKLTLTIDEEAGRLSLTGWVEETRFHFQKLRLKTTLHMQMNQPGFEIEDEIINFSGSPAEAQLLYHINIGQPWLQPGAELLAPVQELVPRNEHAATGLADWTRYGQPQAGNPEQVYLAKLHSDAAGDTQTLLRSADQQRAVQLRFNTKQLPCFTVWKNTTDSADGYVTGIEPGTNFPNPRSFEGQQGRVIPLDAGASQTIRLGVRYCPDADSVQQAEQQVQALATAPPLVHDSPQPTWCA